MTQSCVALLGFGFTMPRCASNKLFNFPLSKLSGQSTMGHNGWHISLCIEWTPALSLSICKSINCPLMFSVLIYHWDYYRLLTLYLHWEMDPFLREFAVSCLIYFILNHSDFTWYNIVYIYQLLLILFASRIIMSLLLGLCTYWIRFLKGWYLGI